MTDVADTARNTERVLDPADEPRETAPRRLIHRPGLFVPPARLRRPLAFTGLAAMTGVLMTWLVLPPPLYADPYHVFRAAQLWPNLSLDFPDVHQAMRLGLVLPTRVAQEIFGPGQLAFVAAAAVFAALFTAGTYLVGRVLFGDLAGLISLALLIIHPFFTVVDPYVRAVAWSTGELMPDMPATGLFGIGVMSLVVAARREGRTQTGWLVGAGLCFGSAYLVREYIAFMFPAIPVFLLLLGIWSWRRVLTVAIPMLSILVFELIHNALVFGDPFARLTVAAEHGGELAEPLSRKRVLLRFDEAMDWHALGVVFTIAAIVTFLGAAVTRDRRLVLLVTWFVSLWLPLTLLGGIINPDEPSLRTFIVRYWIPVFPPIVLGAVVTIGLLARRLGPTLVWRTAVLVPVLAVTVVGYVAPALGELQDGYRDRDWRELRVWLSRHPEVTVFYSDDRTAQTASFYVRTANGDLIWGGDIETFPNRIRELPTQEIGQIPYLQSRYGSRERPDPADGWRVVWRSSNRVLTLWQR